MTVMKYQVDFEPLGKRVDVPRGTILLETSRLAGLPLTADCGGAGSCGQCRVIAREQDGTLSSLTLTEQAQLTNEERAAGLRLACQAGVLGDVKIDVPRRSLISEQRLQVESGILPGAAQRLAGDAVVQCFRLTAPEPSLHDPRSDLERVLAVLAEETGISPNSLRPVAPAALRALPGLLRAHQNQVQLILRGRDTIAAFLPPDARPLGLAVDLGTTKVAAYLVDMRTEELLAAEGRPNPQIGYGEDVVSRLGYVMHHADGSRILSQAIYNTLAELAQELAARAGGSTAEIVEGCIVGNTAMIHILLELPVEQLALAPYIAATTLPQEIRAAEMGLPFAGDARITIPPCVAGYVGADLVAMAYASGIGQQPDGHKPFAVLGIDIGTNTEIILSLEDGIAPRLLSLSCASGPAFEGAHIKAGMRAAAGAIERVWLDGEKPRVQAIGGAAPVGICGSGIIDVVAEMRRAGVINARGRLQAGVPGVREGAGGLEFLLVPAEETGTGEAITITQNDVDEIQFAKGAIKAGITVLLEVAGRTPADLDEIVLAGAFGSYLNLDTASAIGLLPDVPLEKYRHVGNAAGVGAQRILVSAEARDRAAALARRVEYIELSTYPAFRKIYAKAMAL